MNNKTMGAMLLLAGNCIGAGMLALPILTGIVGFFPGILIFVICWFFMMYTGILLLEVNVYYGNGVSIISMVNNTLGAWAKFLAWSIYLFLFTSLLVAYISIGGDFFSVLAAKVGLVAPAWLSGIVFVLFFGIFVFAGTRFVDYINRFLMFGLILSYFLFIFIGVEDVNIINLLHKQYKFIPWVIPVVLTSFGYHNVIPSLSIYLNNDIKKLRKVVFYGSLIPLLMYIVWEALILGIIPVNRIIEASVNGDSPVLVLESIKNNFFVVCIIQGLSFFAIVTSFLGCSLGLLDFLADAFKIDNKKVSVRFWLCVLVFAVPYIFSLIYPGVFLTALSYAGGFGAVSLFGILPALMVWSLSKKVKFDFIIKKWALVLVILFSIIIFVLEGMQEFGFYSLKSELKYISEKLEIDQSNKL